MKVVLLVPPPRKHIEKHDARQFPHLGLAYIAGYLRSRHIECSVFDCNFERLDITELKKRLLATSPDVVGITSMTHEISRAGEVAGEVKKLIPKVTIVVGGAHATALPTQTLEEFSSFDVAVFGEGEHTLEELAKAVVGGLGFENIRGIAHRTPNGISQNSPRPLIGNLDELPFPAWDLFPKAEDYPLITARGCPFGCNFCMRLMGRQVRQRSVKNVFAELQDCVDKYHPKHIHILDETLTINVARLHELLDLMIKNGLPNRISWDAQSRCDIGDFELFVKMKAAGLTWLGLGIESGNEEILRASGKGIKLQRVEHTVGIVKKAHIKVDGFFILGHPFETVKTAMDTINFAIKLNPTRMTLGIMTPYPGTEIYELAKTGGGGYRLLSADWSDFNKNIGNSLELRTLNRKQLEKLQMLGYFKFYLFNLRFIDGAKYFLSQWRLGLAILRKYFFGGGTS